MSISSEVLNRVARSGEAVFARDSAERIVFWNRKCEELLGRSARSVLGKHCHEITAGRDQYGNVYCHHGCPIASQARNLDDPVRRFPLRIDTERGPKFFEVGTFAIPSYHPSLSTVVHVLRAAKPGRTGRPSETEAAGDSGVEESLSPAAAALTPRERETLKLLARGMTVPEIARKLFISPVTVRNHVAAVLQKFNVHSKFAAVAFAYRHRLV